MSSKKLHAVICEECDFLFEEYAVFPSDDWYAATDHEADPGHEVRLVHAAV
jgi:hypothetical protein